MGSDYMSRQRVQAWRPVGHGCLVTFRCDRCQRNMTTAGRKQWRVGKLVRGWLCRECV